MKTHMSTHWAKRTAVNINQTGFLQNFWEFDLKFGVLTDLLGAKLGRTHIWVDDNAQKDPACVPPVAFFL